MRKSTVNPGKTLYKLHVIDEGYFSDYSDYSKTRKYFEKPVSKNTLVYAHLDYFSGVSRVFKIKSSRHANVIEKKSSSKLDDTYFKDLFSMYPVFFLKNDKWVESYMSLSKDKKNKPEIILTKGYKKLSPEIWIGDSGVGSHMASSMEVLYDTKECKIPV